MNNQNAKIFTEAVKAKVEKSNSLGTKSSWSTEDHLKAMAQAVEQDGGVNTLAVLADTYNISGFQQKLAKAFESTGHFQRRREKNISSDDLISQLARELGA